MAKHYPMREAVYRILDLGGLQLLQYGQKYTEGQGFTSHHDGTYSVLEPESSRIRFLADLEQRVRDLFIPYGLQVEVFHQIEVNDGSFKAFLLRFRVAFAVSDAGKEIPSTFRGTIERPTVYNWRRGTWV